MQGKKQWSADQKKVGKKVGCGICGCALTIPAFIAFMIYITTFSNYCARMFGEETYPIAGDPTRFDPVAGIQEVQAKVGAKAILLSVNARSVRSDGTMDLNATYSPAPSADYTFLVPLDKAPEDQTAPPIGAGRGPNDVWTQEVRVKVYKPGQRLHVRRMSGNSSSEYSYTNEGMDIDRSTPRMDELEEGIKGVKVSTKEMWEVAKKLDANLESVATIEFKPDYSSFSIIGTDVRLRWDKDGKLEKSSLRTEQIQKLGLDVKGHPEAGDSE